MLQQYDALIELQLACIVHTCLTVKRAEFQDAHPKMHWPASLE
jgi:hypothetical protein